MPRSPDMACGKPFASASAYSDSAGGVTALPAASSARTQRASAINPPRYFST